MSYFVPSNNALLILFYSSDFKKLNTCTWGKNLLIFGSFTNPRTLPAAIAIANAAHGCCSINLIGANSLTDCVKFVFAF